MNRELAVELIQGPSACVIWALTDLSLDVLACKTGPHPEGSFWVSNEIMKKKEFFVTCNILWKSKVILPWGQCFTLILLPLNTQAGVVLWVPDWQQCQIGKSWCRGSAILQSSMELKRNTTVWGATQIMPPRHALPQLLWVWQRAAHSWVLSRNCPHQQETGFPRAACF